MFDEISRHEGTSNWLLLRPSRPQALMWIGSKGTNPAHMQMLWWEYQQLMPPHGQSCLNLRHVVILTITAGFFYSLVIIVISYNIKIYMLTKSKINFGHYDNKNNKHRHWIRY